MAFKIFPDPTVDPGNDHDHPFTVAASGATGLKTIGPLPDTGVAFIRFAWIGGGPNPSISLKADTGDETPVPIDGFTHPVFNLPQGGGVDAGDAQVDAPANGVYLLRLFLNTAADWKINFKNSDVKPHSVVWVVADTDNDSKQPWIHLTFQNAAPPDVKFDAKVGDAQKNQILEIRNLGTGATTVSGIAPAMVAPFAVSALPLMLPADASASATLTILFDPPQTPGQLPAALHRLVTSAPPDPGPFGSGHNDGFSVAASTQPAQTDPGGEIPEPPFEQRCRGRRPDGTKCTCTGFIRGAVGVRSCARPGCRHPLIMHTQPQ